MRILLIEDEEQIARVLKLELESEGYEVEVRFDGKTGLERALEEKDALILLDVMLPHLNGMEVLRRVRNKNIKTPIIMLTARSMTIDKVAGLDQGANDYVTKPFEIEELLARIRALIRNNVMQNIKEKELIYSVKDLSINMSAREVKRDETLIFLTPKEFELLVFLVENKNRVVTRESILQNVWGFEFEIGTNVIDVFIRHLRKKIDEGFSSQLITTVRGVGYTIKE
jgi:DNA-binding response OmpR family regulator